ncbi:MAG: allantoate amidohydrolase [Betaproteobacteria bacterium]|nr:allantoate amidohydrolase [Betaproteobacteria bacterium]
MINPRRILDHAEQLARCSEQADGLTRICYSKEARAANALVLEWMREAGMAARVDAIGNVVGRYEGERPELPCLMFGSHLDTVRNGGKYDGMLGVISPIECVRALHEAGRRLPFAVEVVGFADEEGVRFGSTFLGSRAIAGTFDQSVLDIRDQGGMTMRETMIAFGLDPAAIATAARRREDVLAYAEIHIEQGPVLEADGLPVGVVTAINGFTRKHVTIKGMAGHAGTVPMRLRQDALAAAAECVLAVERIASGEPDLVGTVGRIEALPGAINVIPGDVHFTIDIRAPRDEQRLAAVEKVDEALRLIGMRRKVAIKIEDLQATVVAQCAPWLMQQLDDAVAADGIRVMHLPSGAGHDGQAMHALADICMLFVRCRGGISHNPAESITEEDAGISARVLARFIEQFRPGG